VNAELSRPFSLRLATARAPKPAPPGPAAEPVAEFRSAILPHLDGAYNLACYITRDAALSEDIVQEAFLRAFKAFPQFRGGSARAWLLTIVRNCSLSALSARNAANVRTIGIGALSRQDAERLEQRPDEEPDPEQSLIAREGAQEMSEWLSALPEPFREALVLREFEDLSYKEIAEVTGVAIGTVMSRLARGRAILAQVIGDRSGEPHQPGEAT
jgi:RNA polymerase sigma factor (sigma-70 family)